MSIVKRISTVLVSVLLFPCSSLADIFIPTPHRTLIFTPEGTGFVIGDGSLYRTDDGGVTWARLTERVPDHSDFSPRDGFFLDKMQGWLVSGDRILATKDGGMSWKDISPSHRSSTKPDCWDNHLRVRFITPLIGWVVGTGGRESSCIDITYVLRTQDGGRTWRRIFFDWRPFPHGALLFDFCFWGNQRGWAIGSDAVYVTEDGGEKWRRQASVPEGYRSPHDWPTIGFVDANWGWAKANGQVMFTSNGGRTWILNSALKEVPYVRTVFFVDRTIGFVSGEGFLLRTADGGKHWRKVGSGGVAFQLAFADRNNGWAMDSNLKDAFRITKTVDAGSSWSITCPSSIQPPCAAASPNPACSGAAPALRSP